MRIVKVLILLFTVYCLLFTIAFAQEETLSETESSSPEVEIYIFHRIGCGGCTNALRFLGALTRKYPGGFTIKDFELARASQETFDLYFALGDVYNRDMTTGPTPVIYLAEKVWVGYDTSVGVQIEQELVKCMAQGCISPIEKLEQAGPNQAGAFSQINPWLAWLIVIIVLGGIIFIVIKVSRR